MEFACTKLQWRQPDTMLCPVGISNVITIIGRDTSRQSGRRFDLSVLGNAPQEGRMGYTTLYICVNASLFTDEQCGCKYSSVFGYSCLIGAIDLGVVAPGNWGKTRQNILRWEQKDVYISLQLISYFYKWSLPSTKMMVYAFKHYSGNITELQKEGALEMLNGRFSARCLFSNRLDNSGLQNLEIFDLFPFNRLNWNQSSTIVIELWFTLSANIYTSFITFLPEWLL